jgi:transposase
MTSQHSASQPLLFVGIDWADREHAVAWIDFQHNQGQESFLQKPQAIAEWVRSLEQRFPNHRILIALEQSRGALIAGLASFPHLELYPLNPHQLASYRTALYPSGGKNDPDDAALLAKFLEDHHARLRPWSPDSTETRQIAELSELRRKLVEDRKQLVAKLNSSLKLYFPLILDLLSRELHNDLILDLLRRWPTLAQLKRASPNTLRRFLAEHRIKDPERQTRLIETIRSTPALTKDKALVQPRARYVQAIVDQIRKLNQAIGEFETEIAELTAQHPDEPIFRSIPGAGDALVPRLIAAFGSDRERYQSAEQIQNYSGIAPITKQSGKSRSVLKRYGCPKFLRQTFHEFADHARKWSAWSKAFYHMKRAAGMKHHAALRALAYKWIRIMFRLWKTNTKYDEARYIEQLKRTGSPVLQFLEN